MAKRRTKRDVFMEPTDPKFPQQWYLVSAGGVAAPEGGLPGCCPQPGWGGGGGGGRAEAAALRCVTGEGDARALLWRWQSGQLPLACLKLGLCMRCLPLHRARVLAQGAVAVGRGHPLGLSPISERSPQPHALCKTPVGTAESRAKAASTDGSGGVCTPRLQLQQLDIADNIRASFGSTTPTSGT